MFGLGALELVIILVIVLVLFGGSKLPALAKSLSKSAKEFKKGVASEPDEEQAAKAGAATAASPAPPRQCSYCKGPLEAAWSHCPSCGAPAAKAPTPGS